MKKHQHTYAEITDKQGNARTIKNSLEEITAGDIIETFESCPECGTKLKYSVFISHDEFVEMYKEDAERFKKLLIKRCKENEELRKCKEDKAGNTYE